MPKPVRRAVFAGLLLFVGLAVFGVTQLPSAPAEPAAEFQPRVTPDKGGQLPRQGRIVIDMPAGSDGQLTVAQKSIPADQLNRDIDKLTPGNRQFIFQPGPNKVFEFFPGGPNCATFIYWRRDTPDQKFTKNWCFTVV